MDGPRRAAYASMAAILLLAALIQAIILARLPTISADGIIFIGIARDLAQAPIETMQAEDQHPGYPGMLLACTQLARLAGYGVELDAWIAGSVIASFVCGLLSVAVVWFLARDLFDARVAAAAAIIFAVLPVARQNAVDAQSDSPHALFYLLAAWMATTGITSGSLWRLAAAGAASGVAYWIRPDGAEVVLVALPFLVWHALGSDWSWRRRIAATAALAGTALVVAAPYPLLAGKVTSKQLPGAKAKLTRIKRELASTRALVPPSPKPEPPTVDKRASQSPPRAVAPKSPPAAAKAPAPPQKPRPEAQGNKAAEPAVAVASLAAPTPKPEPPARRYSVGHVLWVLGDAIAAFINSITQGLKFIFIPPYLLGMAVLAWQRKPAAIQIAFLSALGVTHMGILMCLQALSGYIAYRHVIPLLGLAAPFAALGLWQAGKWAARLLGTRPAYCFAAGVAICCAVVMPYTLRQLNREFVPVIEAARWIQSRAEPGSGVICNSPYVGFYATLPVTELGPQAPTLEAALAAAPSGARYDYAVLHVGAHAYRPEWIGQLERNYRPVLELPVDNASGRPGKVVVFQARQPRVRHAARDSR